MKHNETKRAWLSQFSALRSCLLPIASCLLIFALSGCQGSEPKATTEALTAPIAKASPPPPTPAPSIDPNVTDLERVKEGKPALDFALENLDRKVYRLSDYKGKKNIVLVFYRGFF
jgi:hypothetical protein